MDTEIQSLQRGLERRLKLIRESSLGSFQFSLLEFWNFFDRQPILREIRQNLINEFPKISDKVYQVLQSTSSEYRKTNSYEERMALACEVLHQIAREESNVLRRGIISSVYPAEHTTGGQDEVDRKNLNDFKRIYLDPFDVYLEEQIEAYENTPTKNNPEKDNLVNTLLSPSQRLWLETILAKQNKGEEISERVLKIELRKELSKDFNPSEIDSRLLRSKTNITLFGIGLLEPESEIVSEANEVIQCIQGILSKSPKTEKITAKEVSNLAGISESVVEDIFERLSYIGLFHNTGVNGSNGLSAINIDDRSGTTTFENYFRHETIAQWLEEIAQNSSDSATVKTYTGIISNMPNHSDSKKVFIVHGHDDGAKETVARFIAQLELVPIILHEQPNAGKTIIEKFEHHSDVRFAVILLTPDDSGFSKTNPTDVKSRARQNVILELGYFFAKLTRSNVCALYKDGVELPSDIQGVLYTSMDNDGLWKYKLAGEMRAAGLEVDMNKIG